MKTKLNAWLLWLLRKKKTNDDDGDDYHFPKLASYLITKNFMSRSCLNGIQTDEHGQTCKLKLLGHLEQTNKYRSDIKLDALQMECNSKPKNDISFPESSKVTIVKAEKFVPLNPQHPLEVLISSDKLKKDFDETYSSE
jgi:hypothetical protein